MVHGNWPKLTIMQLVLRGRSAIGTDMVNVFHFEASGVQDAGPMSDATAQAWAEAQLDDWRANLMASFLDCLPSYYTLPTLKAQVLERGGQFEHALTAVEKTYSTNIAGTFTPTDAQVDLTVAGVIRWRSLIASRHARGRTYMPYAYTQGSTTTGLITTGQKTRYETFADAMIARYSGLTPENGALFTIYSRPYSAPDGAYAKRVAGVLTIVNNTTNYDGNSNNITGRVVDDVARVQRRRERGVGS